jgi:hypothetical protein
MAVLVCLLTGARANAKGDDLITAAEKGDLHRVKTLLAKGTDVNAKVSDGGTALILASNNGHLEVVQALLAKGAEVNAKANNGSTALMAASLYGHLEVVQALLAKGAEVNANADKGWTALILASQHGHLEVVEALLAKGADVNVKTADGLTALSVASANGHQDVVTLFKTGFAPVEIVITKEINSWKRKYDDSDYAPMGAPPQPGITIFGQGMGLYCIRRNNSDYIASTSIPSPDGKTFTKGNLVIIRTMGVGGNGYVSGPLLSGYVCTPRVSSIGKLDLSEKTKITDNPEFNFESFKNSPFVIPFSNGYGVNIYMQEVNDDGVLTTAKRYYVSDEGKPLYGRLIRSHFGKLEEIIIAP